jgi:hypothetical protein
MDRMDRMDRHYLKAHLGDRQCHSRAAGHDFSLFLRSLMELVRANIRAFAEAVSVQNIA